MVTGFKVCDPVEEPARAELNIVAKAIGTERPTSVASVLMPTLVRDNPAVANDAIVEGQKLFGRGRRKGIKFSTWRHTYFERITGAWYDRAGRRNEIKPNSLLEVITKANRWGGNRSSSFYLHTDLMTDRFKTLGSPCLQYVQFRMHDDDQVSLVALYRSHHFETKALGNFLGLTDLGKFVARHTDRQLDRIDVVSLHPFYETKTRLRNYRDAVSALL